jgi:hypothetical protein
MKTKKQAIYKKEEALPGVNQEGFIMPAITYFRPWDYHRPVGLSF